jgi:hypothetical protein
LPSPATTSARLVRKLGREGRPASGLPGWCGDAIDQARRGKRGIGRAVVFVGFLALTRRMEVTHPSRRARSMRWPRRSRPPGWSSRSRQRQAPSRPYEGRASVARGPGARLLASIGMRTFPPVEQEAPDDADPTPTPGPNGRKAGR